MMEDSSDVVNNRDQPVPCTLVATASATTGAAANTPASSTNPRARLKWEPITLVQDDGTVIHPFITMHDN